LGDGSASSDPEPTHVYPDPGDYQIDLLVISDNGCRDSAVAPVRVIPAPLVDFGTQDVCLGFETQFVDLSTPVTGSIVQYDWSFGDGGSSNDQSPLYIYSSPGWFDVTLTVTSDSGCQTRLIRDDAIQIYPPPVAQFIDNAYEASDIYPVVNFTNLTGALGTYAWDFGDGYFSNEYSPAHEYDTVGQYEVQLIAIDQNGCVDTIIRRIDIRPTSNVYVPNSFTPNGDLKNDVFRVYTYNVANVSADIFDRWGLLIYHWDGLTGGWDGNVDGNAVQNDVYVYRIVTTDVNGKREERVGRVSVVR
jgi:gliding motility-associated-like protein